MSYAIETQWMIGLRDPLLSRDSHTWTDGRLFIYKDGYDTGNWNKSTCILYRDSNYNYKWKKFEDNSSDTVICKRDDNSKCKSGDFLD